MTRIGNHVPDWDPASPTRTQLSFIDARRAYFNAKIDQTDEPVYVSLPEEDPDTADKCARLLRHMYGARRAADGWQEGYSTLMIWIGPVKADPAPTYFTTPTNA